MSRIPQGKVLVKAGKFQGGKLPFVNYVGQIRPADMPSILWWGAFGSDITGDGTIAAPFETFPAALAAFSTTIHRWILNTDLSVYGEAGPGPYIDDPADRVYLDPTKADDSGDGLTAANAKKTYAAAVTALGSSGRSVIHCVGSFTLSDLITEPTQGEIGETLTYDVSPDYVKSTLVSTANRRFYKIVKLDSGVLVALGVNTSTGATVILRSTDAGANWSTISNPWTSKSPQGIAANGDTLVVCGFGAGTTVLLSTDAGLTWTAQSVGGTATNYFTVTFSGTNFVIVGTVTGGGAPPNVTTYIRYSPDGTTWSASTATIPLTGNTGIRASASDGLGNVMITGREDGTTPFMFYSTDDGQTFTDYSGLVGVGLNTGGILCPAVEFADGFWFIFQDTISPAIYFSDDPTTAWQDHADSVYSAVGGSPQNGGNVGYSEALGGFVFVTSNAITPEIFLINANGVTLISSIDCMYNVYGTFVNSVNGVETLFVLGDNNSGTGLILKLTLTKTNIQAGAANVKIHSGEKLSSIGGLTFSNVDTTPTTGDALTLGDRDLCRSSRIVSADAKALTHLGNFLKLRRNLIKGATANEIAGVAAATGDIEISQNIIIGDTELQNSGGTDKELIQDNIIEGDLTCEATVTIRSNIRGAVVNSSALSKISTINPLFVDAVNYFLSRVALGQAFDSPLINRSAIYNYSYNAVTYKDDFGPYRAFIALVETTYKRAFYLPRFSGNALNEDVENSSALFKSINGVPDVSNRPNARLEIVSWPSKSVDGYVREFVDFMERGNNMQVELYYDFDETVLDDLVVNGAHGSGTFEVNIVPKDIPVGTVLSVNGLTRYVTQRYPRSGDAEKIILDEVLTGGLADGETIQVEQVQGAGTYLFSPEKRRQNKRVFSRRRDTYTGMQYTFVRKKQ